MRVYERRMRLPKDEGEEGEEADAEHGL